MCPFDKILGPTLAPSVIMSRRATDLNLFCWSNTTTLPITGHVISSLSAPDHLVQVDVLIIKMFWANMLHEKLLISVNIWSPQVKICFNPKGGVEEKSLGSKQVKFNRRVEHIKITLQWTALARGDVLRCFLWAMSYQIWHWSEIATSLWTDRQKFQPVRFMFQMCRP